MLLLVWFAEIVRSTRDVDLLGFGELSDDELRRINRSRRSGGGQREIGLSCIFQKPC